jgi:RNA polymerase sigma factor (sigma-70 family)
LVREGHERAFEALVHRYRRPLLGYCRRLRLSDARAEDIVQLALLKTWIAVREGAEVRDLKAWLYRVVHNTAVNALRDSAHEGQSFADPAHALEACPPHQPADDSQLDRGLAMREALAEVAALPPLQREVIVRTAVAGHSHEQVASDLGITNGAVRGLLYRARTTLRTAITVLTPPQLLGWLAGRSDQGGPAPERLAELAGGGGVVGVGGAAGVGGLLVKGSAVALTVGTVITGAAVVHLSASTHHGNPRRLIAAAVPSRGAGGGSAADSAADEALSEARDRGLSTGAGAHRGASGRHAGSRTDSTGAKARARIDATGGGSAGTLTPAGHRAPRSTTRVTGDAHNNASAKAPAAQGPAPGLTQGSGSTQGSGQTGAGSGPGFSQSGGSGQGGESGTGSGGPVGSAAGNGSAGGTDASGSSGGSSEGGASGGGQSGSESGSGSDSESSPGSSESSGSGGSSSGSNGSSGSESSGSEQSGSLVGTVVHEVGSILEHLLH